MCTCVFFLILHDRNVIHRTAFKVHFYAGEEGLMASPNMITKPASTVWRFSTSHPQSLSLQSHCVYIAPYGRRANTQDNKSGLRRTLQMELCVAIVKTISGVDNNSLQKRPFFFFFSNLFFSKWMMWRWAPLSGEEHSFTDPDIDTFLLWWSDCLCT